MYKNENKLENGIIRIRFCRHKCVCVCLQDKGRSGAKIGTIRIRFCRHKYVCVCFFFCKTRADREPKISEIIYLNCHLSTAKESLFYTT